MELIGKARLVGSRMIVGKNGKEDMYLIKLADTVTYENLEVFTSKEILSQLGEGRG